MGWIFVQAKTSLTLSGSPTKRAGKNRRTNSYASGLPALRAMAARAGTARFSQIVTVYSSL